METREPRSKIVVGIDGSSGSRAAAAWALEEARRRQADIEAVNAWHNHSLAYTAAGFGALLYTAAGYGPQRRFDEIEAESQNMMESVLADHSDVKVNLRCVDGRPAEALRDAAREPGVALIVVGARGHEGVVGSRLGSVSNALTHHLEKPMVIVPLDEPQVLDRIVVGVDGSSEADEALRWAAAEASLRPGTTLEVVVAWSTSFRAIFPEDFPKDKTATVDLRQTAVRIAAEAVNRLGDTDLQIEQTISEGHPAAALIDRAAFARLLVVGTHGAGRAHETLGGSVSYSCAHHSPIPVAIVPARI